jgi:DNA repair protein RecO (recombination protein O)
MLHSTKAIVLRSVKYGETSLVATLYTEKFGRQSYILNGVRSEKRSSHRANLYQAATILDAVVYHSPHKNLQRIKEAHVHMFYNALHANIVKNTIAIFISELIYKTITEPESHIELYSFFENSLLHIDTTDDGKLANFPILFTFQLADHLGFGLQNSWSVLRPILDMSNGQFCARNELTGTHFTEGEHAQCLSDIAHEVEIETGKINREQRSQLLMLAIQYLKVHLPHLGELKSIEVLHAILS